jgi:hypothetical protein
VPKEQLVQDDEEAELQEPAGHMEHSEAPASLKKPAEQPKQISRLVELE